MASKRNYEIKIYRINIDIFVELNLQICNMKKTYKENLKNPKWQKKRLKILKRDDFKCRCCDSDLITKIFK